MAIEPLGSIMSLQAQQISQPVNNAQKENMTTDGQNFDGTIPVAGDTTVTVQKTGFDNNTEENEEKGKQSFNEEMMREAMKELNKKATNVEAEFGIHEKTNRITIKMVDKQTKKVIKELPPEKMLDMIARIWEVSGLIVDEKR